MARFVPQLKHGDPCSVYLDPGCFRVGVFRFHHHQTPQSLSRCFEVRPRSDTSYTLTARKQTGESVNQTITVKVQ